MAKMTYVEVLNRLSEKTYDNTKQLRRGVAQRRNGMEDLYGIVFSAEGDANSPASFYISLSPDYVYLERFAFKFVIKPYMMTVTGGTEAVTVTVNSKELEASESGNDIVITPNPHTHTTQSHTHNLIKGKTFTNTVSDYWRVKIHGIDITPYLIEQHNDEWIDMTDADGERIFPSNALDDREDFYDILDVASMLTAEGEIEKRDLILKPEFKKVEIISDAPFAVDAYLYLKYSHSNR